MMVSDYCRDFVASWEGYSEAAYLCPAGVWTIGYGHTHGVKAGDRITPQAAKDLLAADLVSYGVQVGLAIAGAPSTDQQEFDSMVSLAFNIGVAGFAGSSVCRLHKAGDKAGAARSFGLWNKAVIGGVLQPVLGLTRRRAAETSLYLTPDEVPLPVPTLQVAADEMPQKVEPPKPATQSKTVIAGTVAVASGAASVADQLSQIQPTLDAVNAFGASVQSILKLGAIGLTVIGVAAAAYFLIRYLKKRREGDVVST